MDRWGCVASRRSTSFRAGLDRVDSRVRRGDGPQPLQRPGNLPAGFIGRDDRGMLKAVLDFPVGGLQALAGPQHDLGRGSTAEMDTEQRAQGMGDFPVGHAGAFIEIDNGRLSVGAQLTGSGTHGVGRLQRMPALTVAAAAPTLAKMNIELSHDRLARNFLLVLGLDVGFLDVATTVGTGVRQRRFIGFVDVIGRQAMAVLAMPGTGLAAGPFLFRFARAQST